MDVITIWHGSHFLWVSRTVAERFGLKDNQKIENEKDFTAIIHANASHLLSICEAKLQPKN